MVTLVNRAKVSTATTGTGTITLGSAESGYQTFADAGVVDADVVRYVIEDGTNWEIGSGTYTASGTTLSRTVLESSNADAAINLSGSAVVFVGAAAEDLAPVDTTNLEVTNIKAKDGTASATIANSTGVLTVASSVLTTADINGGSIDGTVIGGSTPAAIGGTTGTFSGDVSIADKIVHTGDTNTAIRFPAADTVAIETNGAERLRVTSAGKVGIGTSSPFGQLTLGASGSASLYLEDGASSSTSNRYIAFFNDNGLRVQTRTDANTFVSNDYLITTVASGANTHRWQTANTEKMRLSSAGKLLIGTTFTGVSILRLVGLPTSSAGLFSGDVWNDGGTLKIV